MAIKRWFWSCRPVQRLRWRELEDGRVVVLRPPFGGSRIGRGLASVLGLRDDRIRLDEIGAAVWKRCDGRTTAGEITREVQGRFGSRIQPADERVQTFIVQMSRARMIDIEIDDSPESQ